MLLSLIDRFGIARAREKLFYASHSQDQISWTSSRKSTLLLPVSDGDLEGQAQNFDSLIMTERRRHAYA